MRFSAFALLIGAPLCLALPGSADVCDTPGNVVQNCDFSEGTYTASIPYLQPPFNNDPGVPDAWAANPGFIEGYLVTGQDTVMMNPVTGADYLSMGTGEFGPEATLSQELADVGGVTYDISGVDNDPGSFGILIGGEFVIPDSKGFLSFVGTGSDELTLVAYAGASFDINDVIVAPAGESEVPEPRMTFLIPVAMLMSLVWLSRHRRATHP